jgi:hypothetical protein
MGNDQINIGDGYYGTDAYNQALRDFYAAFDATFSNHPDSRVFYIESTIVHDEGEPAVPLYDWDAFRDAEVDACTNYSPTPRCVHVTGDQAVPLPRYVLDQYNASAECPPDGVAVCPWYRDDAHWEYATLVEIGTAAGQEAGAYMAGVLGD